MDKKYILRLYLVGETPGSKKLVENLKVLFTEQFNGEYDFEVIDVIEHPQLAQGEKIFATPTLIKKVPPPIRRIIGDFCAKEKVLLGLDLV